MLTPLKAVHAKNHTMLLIKPTGFASVLRQLCDSCDCVAGDAPDDALDRHIQMIKERNAQILARRQEVELDKQKYG